MWHQLSPVIIRFTCFFFVCVSYIVWPNWISVHHNDECVWILQPLLQTFIVLDRCLELLWSSSLVFYLARSSDAAGVLVVWDSASLDICRWYCWAIAFFFIQDSVSSLVRHWKVCWTFGVAILLPFHCEYAAATRQNTPGCVSYKLLITINVICNSSYILYFHWINCCLFHLPFVFTYIQSNTLLFNEG